MEFTIAILLAVCALAVVSLEFYLPGGVMAAFGSVIAIGSILYAMLYDLKLGLWFFLAEAVLLFIFIRMAWKRQKKSSDQQREPKS